MDGVQIAQQDSLRIARRCAGCMTAADDSLLDRASRGVRIRGSEIPLATTTTAKSQLAAQTDADQTTPAANTSPALANIRSLGGDWRASI